MPKQPTPAPRSTEAKMRGLAIKYVARHGWPASEFDLNRLVQALQEALPKRRPTEVTQRSGTVAGRRGRAGGSVARSGARTDSGPRAASQAVTGASEGFGASGGAA
jgi:hypothetical protein